MGQATDTRPASVKRAVRDLSRTRRSAKSANFGLLLDDEASSGPRRSHRLVGSPHKVFPGEV